MLTILMSIENEDDRSFVASIYRKYAKQMKAIAYNILKNEPDAEDCVHETVITIVNKLEVFKSSEDERYLKWLILLVCKNTALNIQKKNMRRQNREISLASYTDGDGEEKAVEFADDSPTPEESVISEDNVKYILALLNRLEPKYRDVILLKYRGWSNKDIADMLFISQGSVRQLLFRAKKQLIKMGGGRLYE